MRHKIFTVFLTFCMMLTLIPVTTVVAEASDYQYAMYIFPNYLDVSNNDKGHVVKEDYPDRKPVNIIGSTGGTDNAYAPFDCKVVSIPTEGGNAIVIESKNEVYFADGTRAHMTILVAHDNNIKGIKVGDEFDQGEVFYQAGTAGEANGNHIHMEVARGAFSKQKKLGVWQYVRAAENAVRPNEALYLCSDTQVNRQGGYVWKRLNSVSYKDLIDDITPPPVSVTTTTKGADSITTNSAILRGYVQSTGSPVVECGMYIGTTNDRNKMTKLGSDKNLSTYGTNFYYSTEKYGYTLKPGTTYYYVAYATTKSGKTDYGDIKSFPTKPNGKVPATPTIKLSDTTITTDGSTVVSWDADKNSVQYLIRIYEDSTNKKIEFIYTKNTKNTLSGLAAGTYAIYAQGFNSSGEYGELSNRLTLTVTEKATYDIKLNRSTLSISEVACETLTATTTPSDQKVTWKSSDTSIATVQSNDARGSSATVSGVRAGTATITASISYGGKTDSAACTVTITPEAGTSTDVTPTIALNQKSVSVNADASTTLKATVTPSGQSVKWSSSNTKVATVNSSGKVAGVQAGTATITASITYNGKTYQDTCTVTVKAVETEMLTCFPTLNVAGHSSITESTARVDASCRYTGTAPTSVGLYLGTSKSNMNRYGSDTINHSKNPFDIWYNLSDLSAGTTYYYQFYVVANGETKTSEIYSFTTKKAAVTNTLTLSVDGASSIKQTTARVDASCKYTGTAPTSVGLYLGTSKSNMNRYGSDTINHSKNPFNIWYNLKNLSAGTTYYYQFYAVVDGKTQTSEIYSFTTAK